MVKLICTFLLAAVFAGCGSDRAPVKNKREASFFNPLINSSENFEKAEHKLDQLTLLTSSTNTICATCCSTTAKFYYQVENLGNGTGTGVP